VRERLRAITDVLLMRFGWMLAVIGLGAWLGLLYFMLRDV
jgi:hypothetical protein